LQEFLEAQRVVRNAPPVSFSPRDPPGELLKLAQPFAGGRSDAAGYLSFAIEERHLTGANKAKAITLLTGFRNYLHYHIKCSKTYLHMRMRKRVAGWMQVLNRALPDVEGEKKTAAGKTFTRK
jgi:actin related protein 2/3 complex subunit 2